MVPFSLLVPVLPVNGTLVILRDKRVVACLGVALHKTNRLCGRLEQAKMCVNMAATLAGALNFFVIFFNSGASRVHIS